MRLVSHSLVVVGVVLLAFSAIQYLAFGQQVEAGVLAPEGLKVQVRAPVQVNCAILNPHHKAIRVVGLVFC